MHDMTRRPMTWLLANWLRYQVRVMTNDPLNTPEHHEREAILRELNRRCPPATADGADFHARILNSEPKTEIESNVMH